VDLVSSQGEGVCERYRCVNLPLPLLSCLLDESDALSHRAEKESALSIAGHYCCLLSREAGEIEGSSSPLVLLPLFSSVLTLPSTRHSALSGLYSDPTATPFQRLSLSARNEFSGSFSLGTFSTR
jgi:hypothetical protein